MDVDLRSGWRGLWGAKRPGVLREPALASPPGVAAPALVSIFVGGAPFGVAITRDGSRAYVANGSADAVSVIDTATATVSATIPVGMPTLGVAITPDGSHAYVTSGGAVVVIDTATATVGATITTTGTGLTDPADPMLGVAITPDGSQAYVTERAAGTVRVIDIATATFGAPITVGGTPFGVAITPDGRHAYVANGNADAVSVIDTATATVSATIPVGDESSGVAVTPDGSRAYVTNGNAGTVSVIPTVPAVTTISPTQGPTTGDTLVTITGTSLDEVTTVVNFGPNPATDLFLNAAGTQLRATSPGGAGTVPVTVTTSGGTSNAVPFSYLPPAPALTAIAPHRGPTAGGTLVTISGTNLGGATVASFGHSSATGVFFNPAGTQVLATAPGGAGTVPVTVTTPGGASNALDFTYH
jgi:YVTN family beta-propeller protein